jgi:hypothetical protein
MCTRVEGKLSRVRTWRSGPPARDPDGRPAGRVRDELPVSVLSRRLQRATGVHGVVGETAAVGAWCRRFPPRRTSSFSRVPTDGCLGAGRPVAAHVRSRHSDGHGGIRTTPRRSCSLRCAGCVSSPSNPLPAASLVAHVRSRHSDGHGGIRTTPRRSCSLRCAGCVSSPSNPTAARGRHSQARDDTRARWDSNPRPSDVFHRHERPGDRSPTLYPN